MEIKTFRIDGNNRIIVNGTKIMWATLRDLEAIGNTEMSYEDKFKKLVEYRKNNVNIKDITLNKKNVIDNKAKPCIVNGKHYNSMTDAAHEYGQTLNRVQSRIRSKGLTVEEAINELRLENKPFRGSEEYRNKYKLTDEELLDLISDYIDKKTKYIYNKYEGIIIADEEDIRSEIIVEVIKYKRGLDGTKLEVRKTNLESFKRNINYILKLREPTIIGNYTRAVRLTSEPLINSNILIDKYDYDKYNEDTLHYIMKEENISYRNVTKAIGAANLINESQSLEELIEEDTLDDKLNLDIDEIDEIDYNIIQSELRETLEKLLETLTDREQGVIRKGFGLNEGIPMTMGELGTLFNISRNRVSQIEAKALRKFRHPSMSSKIRNYLYGEPREFCMKSANYNEFFIKTASGVTILQEKSKLKYRLNYIKLNKHKQFRVTHYIVDNTGTTVAFKIVDNTHYYIVSSKVILSLYENNKIMYSYYNKQSNSITPCGYYIEKLIEKHTEQLNIIDKIEIA